MTAEFDTKPAGSGKCQWCEEQAARLEAIVEKRRFVDAVGMVTYTNRPTVHTAVCEQCVERLIADLEESKAEEARASLREQRVRHEDAEVEARRMRGEEARASLREQRVRHEDAEFEARRMRGGVR